MFLFLFSFAFSGINDDLKYVIHGNWSIEEHSPLSTDVNYYFATVEKINDDKYLSKIYEKENVINRFEVNFLKHGKIMFRNDVEIPIYIQKQLRFQVSAYGEFDGKLYTLNFYHSGQFELHIIDDTTKELKTYYFVKQVKFQPWYIRYSSFIALGFSLIFAQVFPSWLKSRFFDEQMEKKRKMRREAIRKERENSKPKIE